MADTGFIIVGTGVNDASYGDEAWSSTDRIETDDNLLASTGFLSSGETTQYLKGTNLGLTTTEVPAGSTIDGIEVRVQALFIFSAPDFDRVRLVDEDGTIGATDRSAGETLTDSLVDYDFGGAADLWGDSWSDTDVIDVDFGTVVSFVRAGSSAVSRVDFIAVKVYYTEGGGGPPPIINLVTAPYIPA